MRLLFVKSCVASVLASAVKGTAILHLRDEKRPLGATKLARRPEIISYAASAFHNISLLLYFETNDSLKHPLFFNPLTPLLENWQV